MNYVTLQVPEHLYLQTLAFLAAAAEEHEAAAELVEQNQGLRAENVSLRAVIHDQFEEQGRLRSLLEETRAEGVVPQRERV